MDPNLPEHLLTQTTKVKRTLIYGPPDVLPDGTMLRRATGSLAEITGPPTVEMAPAAERDVIVAGLTQAFAGALVDESENAVATVAAAIKHMAQTHKTLLGAVMELGKSELLTERMMISAEALTAIVAAHPGLKTIVADALDAASAKAADRLARLQTIQEARCAALEQETAGLETIVKAFAAATKAAA